MNYYSNFGKNIEKIYLKKKFPIILKNNIKFNFKIHKNSKINPYTYLNENGEAPKNKDEDIFQKIKLKKFYKNLSRSDEEIKKERTNNLKKIYNRISYYNDEKFEKEIKNERIKRAKQILEQRKKFYNPEPSRYNPNYKYLYVSVKSCIFGKEHNKSVNLKKNNEKDIIKTNFFEKNKNFFKIKNYKRKSSLSNGNINFLNKKLL
jgi:hypothetical protein